MLAKRIAFRNLTIVEILVILSILLMLATFLIPDQNARLQHEIEAQINRWQADAHDRQFPSDGLPKLEMDVVGNWETHSHLEGTRLVISRQNGNTYRFEFQTGGCLGQYSTERIATLQGGMLQLDKPVSEYSGRTYDRLYTIQHDDQEYLLPAVSVAAYEKDFHKHFVFSRATNIGSVPTGSEEP